MTSREEIISPGKTVSVTQSGGVSLLMPQANLDTVRDGRGGIFTWIPPEPIVEFNMLFFRPGAIRGFHYHPHFVEYLLVVDGSGTLVAKENAEGDRDSERFVLLNKGTCVRTDRNVHHTVYAITDMTVVAMLTHRWDQSNPPIVVVRTE